MDARRQRSRGLTRVNRLTGWLAGAAVVASGAFMALLVRPSASPASTTNSNPSPGATSVTASPPAPSSTDADPTTSTSSDGGYQTGPTASVAPAPLEPPVRVPRSSNRQPQVSSGAS